MDNSKQSVEARVAMFGILPGITMEQYLMDDGWEFYIESEDGYDVVYNVPRDTFAYVIGGIHNA